MCICVKIHSSPIFLSFCHKIHQFINKSFLSDVFLFLFATLLSSSSPFFLVDADSVIFFPFVFFLFFYLFQISKLLIFQFPRLIFTFFFFFFFFVSWFILWIFFVLFFFKEIFSSLRHSFFIFSPSSKRKT